MPLRGISVPDTDNSRRHQGILIFKKWNLHTAVPTEIVLLDLNSYKRKTNYNILRFTLLTVEYSAV